MEIETRESRSHGDLRVGNSRVVNAMSGAKRVTSFVVFEIDTITGRTSILLKIQKTDKYKILRRYSYIFGSL
jgi:hypothetical protein